MDKRALELIIKETMKENTFSDNEKEIALKILSSLDGTLVIRAKSILKLCLESVEYTKIKGNLQ